ncbi:hypothetical protein BGZ63DRAFT_232308 [Mariannaea sp. PMI_226]|nr:hypothetical protein BGZ63DRAFT_232308 [Mariannaea sp. PMI_226]
MPVPLGFSSSMGASSLLSLQPLLVFSIPVAPGHPWPSEPSIDLLSSYLEPPLLPLHPLLLPGLAPRPCQPCSCLPLQDCTSYSRFSVASPQPIPKAPATTTIGRIRTQGKLLQGKGRRELDWAGPKLAGLQGMRNSVTIAVQVCPNRLVPLISGYPFIPFLGLRRLHSMAIILPTTNLLLLAYFPVVLSPEKAYMGYT